METQRKTITGIDYAENLALISNTIEKLPCTALSLLPNKVSTYQYKENHNNGFNQRMAKLEHSVEKELNQ